MEQEQPHGWLSVVLQHHPLWILRNYGWYIVFTLIAAALVEKHMLGPWIQRRRADESMRVATKPERVKLLQTDMAMVRQRQQEEAERRSQEAKAAAESKRLAEMEARRIAAPHESKRGRKLGHDEGSSSSSTNATSSQRTPPSSRSTASDRGGGGGYNPMDPSSGHTSGYRSSRRNPRRA